MHHHVLSSFQARPKTLSLSIWLILSALSTQSYADSNLESTQLLDEVVIEATADSPNGLHLKTKAATGSRLGLTPMQTPAHVEVISGQTIKDRGDQTVRQAVTRAAGITSNPTTGNGGTSLASRGFAGHSSVMQLVDGTRFFITSGTTTYPFDTWSIDRIEVLHGASSVLYGEGAIGGVVNVITKKPSQKPIENEARLTVGVDNTFRGAFASGGAINDSWSYQASINAGQSDGWMDKGKEDSLSIAGALRFDPTANLSMTLSYEFAEQNPSVYMGTPLINGKIKESTRKKSYQADGTKINYKDSWLKFNTEWEPTEKLTLRNNLYYLTTKRLWRNAEYFTWNKATEKIDVSHLYEIIHDMKQFGNRFDLAYDDSLFGLNNKTVVGFDFNHIDNNPKGNTPGSAIAISFDPNNPHSYPFINPSYTIAKNSTTVKQSAVFMEDRLSLTDRWSIIGGGRYDYYDIDRKNYVNPKLSWKDSFGKFTWRAGTVFEVTPNLSLYGQYATAADPFSAITSMSDTQKNQGLTKGKQFEVGIKQLLWDEKVEWSLAAYHIKKKKLFSYDPETKNSLPIGAQSSKGFELAIGAQILPSLRIDANGALLEARYDEFSEKGISRNGNVPSSTPQKAANVWVSWEVVPDWTFRPGLRYVGQRYNDAANNVRLPAYTTWDASLEWKMNKNLTWRLHGYNLTDKIYPEAAYNSGKQWVLGRPRSAELSANLSF